MAFSVLVYGIYAVSVRRATVAKMYVFLRRATIPLCFIVNKGHYHATNKNLFDVFARSYFVTGGRNHVLPIHNICVVIDSDTCVMFHDITDP